MRLGINGFFWNHRLTGSGQYTRQLVYGLSRLPDGPEGVLFTTKGGELHTDPESLGASIQGCMLTPSIPLTENLSKLWFEQISFPRACLKRRVETAHVPYFAPPLHSDTKVVVTIHDLIPLILPAYRGSVLVRLYTRLVSAAARRATAIIADSQASKQDITSLLEIPPERIHVVYLAVGEDFRPVQDPQALAQIREKYDLTDQYILYLGGFDQRKNLKTLLSAFSLLVDTLSPSVHLVIAGSLPRESSSFFPDPQVIAQRLGLEDRVSLIGWVPEEDKPALYSAATVFVFPSLYEGFGLPPLEAMACGAPVITSDRSSLPEIGGQGAVLVDPEDTDALAAAIVTLIEDKKGREELAARGLERARGFSWERTAAETLAVYKSVAKA
jgi:glycosyltransferase involved in cell wall biosynthesis